MFRENSIKTCILSSVKQITSPGWMHETSVRGWCTGKTQRDWVEKEVGGEIVMGNTCKSMADSCQVWQKPLEYCKVISLQLIKINGKKLRLNMIYKALQVDSLPAELLGKPKCFNAQYITYCIGVAKSHSPWGCRVRHN